MRQSIRSRFSVCLRMCAVVLLTFASVTAVCESLSTTDFVSSKRSTYTTAGNPKAKGIEVSFEYPNSWSGAEGKRPNILYQITSDNGAGLELCNLMIKDFPLPAGYVLSSKEIDEMFSSSGMRDLVPNGGKFISGNRTTIDGEPSGWVHFEQDINRAGQDIQMSWLMYATKVGDKLMLFSCSVGQDGARSKSELRARYDSNAPLFMQMANSLVIHSKWKGRK